MSLADWLATKEALLLTIGWLILATCCAYHPIRRWLARIHAQYFTPAPLSLPSLASHPTLSSLDLYLGPTWALYRCQEAEDAPCLQ